MALYSEQKTQLMHPLQEGERAAYQYFVLTNAETRPSVVFASIFLLILTELKKLQNVSNLFF